MMAFPRTRSKRWHCPSTCRKRSFLLVLLCAALTLLRPDHPSNSTRRSNNHPHNHHPATQKHTIALQHNQLSTDDDSCFSIDCIRNVARGIARAFPTRTNQSWCIPNPPGHFFVKGHGWQGILLVKVPKAASSTSAGVAIRIARRLGARKFQNNNNNNNNTWCAVQWQHRLAQDYTPRIPQTSLLITSIRDPAQRALSSIYYHAAGSTLFHNNTTTLADSYVLQQFRARSLNPNYGTTSNGRGGYQLQYTSLQQLSEYSAWKPQQPHKVQNQQQLQQHLQTWMQSYDFVLVVERMTESLVALALLLGLDVGDVLTTSSKVAGRAHRWTQHECVPTHPPILTQAVQDYLESDEFQARHYGDSLLHQAANLSLDWTIDQVLGRARFQQALTKFRHLQQLELQECAPHVQFPCSNEGVWQRTVAAENCYIPGHDFGCGYPCIDALLLRHEGFSSL